MGRRRRFNKNQPAKPVNTGQQVALLAAKKSNIPLPIEEVDKKRLYLKWGNKNEYPYYLNTLFRLNPIHSGIIRAKRYFTVSGGLIYEGPDQAGYDSFFNNGKKTHKDNNLEELISDISLNYEISNWFFFHVKFSIVGAKAYRQVDIIPFEKVRLDIMIDAKGNEFYTGNIKVSDNWFDDKVPVKIISPYKPNDPNQTECFVMHKEDSGQSLDDPQKASSINSGFYPDPPYGGGITAIDSGIEILKYSNSEIHNGFSLGTMVYFAGGIIKDEQKKREFERDVKASSTGALQTGGTMLVYGNGQDEKPTIEALNGNNLPDRYMNSKKSMEESIVHAHSITTPILAGIKTEGSLGNATELEVGYAIFKQNYITGRQDAIMSVLNWIMNNIAGIQGTVSFAEVNLQLEQQVSGEDNAASKALNSLSPLVATKVLEKMTPNEIRNLGKLPPVQGGDELPKMPFKTKVKSKSDHEKIMERFAKNGISKTTKEIIFSMPLIGADDVGEMAFMDTFRESFASLTKEQANVLGLINKEESYEAIRSALDLSTSELNDIYKSLESSGYISGKGNITTEGKQQVAISEVESIEIMYDYALRPDAPKLVSGGHSREFCVTLLRLNRLYSREDIDRISGIEGYDVFAYRGGWYHNPNTGKNEPGCRHEWRQVITYKS